MNIKEKLIEIGFSNNEVEIYIALIDYGTLSVGKIVKITGIQKSSCYLAINSLLHKGVISSVKVGNVAHYSAENPKNIIDYIDEKKNRIKDSIDELEKRFKKDKKVQGSVSHFIGEKGIKTIFNDILREGKDNDVFGSEGQLSDRMPIFVKQYMRIQDEKKMKVRNLVGHGRKRKYSKGTSYKYVDKEIKSNVVTNIYGDKIAIIIWDDEPEGVIIENSIAAKAYKNYFEFMWNNAILPDKKKK